MLHATFDKFDICEAYAVLEWDWHIGGILEERPSNTRRNMSTDYQLKRMYFEARQGLCFETLTRNGKAIYLNATRKFKLR